MVNQKENPILVIVLIAAIGLFRAIPFVFDSSLALTDPTPPLFDLMFKNLAELRLGNLIASGVWLLITALLTHFVLNALWIFESRNIIPLVTISLLLSSGGAFQSVGPHLLVPAILLFASFVLFASENFNITPLKVFNLTLIISTGSFLNFYILYLLPLFWGVFIFLRELKFKTVIASIAGFFTSFWILYAILFITDNGGQFWDFFQPVHIKIIDLAQIPQGYLVYIPGLTALALFAFFSFTKEYPKMKQNHRIIFLTSNAVAIYALVLTILGLIPFNISLATALISFTMLFSFFYHHAGNRTRWIFFITLVLFELCSFIEQF